MYGHWRGTFYPADLPQREWFAYYARHLRSVEIDNSFYRLPPPETFRAWREQAPRGFRYAVKGNRYITHVKRLKDPEGPVARFLENARGLGPALGAVLWQLPPRFGADLDRLERFLRALPGRRRRPVHVFEFRDPSWFRDDVYALLDAHGAGFCVYSHPAIPCPVLATGRVAYLRFHGTGGRRYGGLYGARGLRPWAERVRDFLAEGRDVHAYFNNDEKAYAVRDALELDALLAGGGGVRNRERHHG